VVEKIFRFAAAACFAAMIRFAACFAAKPAAAWSLLGLSSSRNAKAKPDTAIPHDNNRISIFLFSFQFKKSNKINIYLFFVQNMP
jgi:hypothetical protein